MEPLLVTPEEAAKVLGIGRSSLYEFLKSGQLESVQIGRSRRIPTDALAAFVDALRASRDELVAQQPRLRCKPDCMLDFAHEAPRHCVIAWDGITPDDWDMDWRPTPAQVACKECRSSLNYPARPVDWMPPEDLGHDPWGHQLSHILVRARLRLADTVSMSDDELLALRNLGQTMLARLRDCQRASV